jgi:UDP-N-acetylmuramyl pentapeptide phosphotransferase/UDP-N-acetylglucosamine-1-phosphate transferase
MVTGAAVTGAAVAAGAALGAYTALRRYPPAGEKTWARTNHRGESVTLLEGPAVTVGAVIGQVIAAEVAARRGRRPVAAQEYPERVRRSAYPLAVAGLGGVAFGVIDDLRGSGKRRGLRGHLGALAHGEVTTGTVKLAGLAATGLGAALLEGGGPEDVAVNAALIAGGANLLNLFDLRPGRAIKVAVLAAGLIAGGSALTRDTSPAAPAPASTALASTALASTALASAVLAGTAPAPGRLAGLAAVAAPAGAALALLPEDLGERAMLGDAGANALGAMLGAAAAQTLPRNARLCLLTGIVALTVASEKVSFTRVIEATPPLRWLDMLGRRPVALAAPVPAGPASAGPASAGPASAGPASAGPASADPASGTASAGEPATVAWTERLAWWIGRRRPGRHRRAKAVR